MRMGAFGKEPLESLLLLACPCTNSIRQAQTREPKSFPMTLLQTESEGWKAVIIYSVAVIGRVYSRRPHSEIHRIRRQEPKVHVGFDSVSVDA